MNRIRKLNPQLKHRRRFAMFHFISYERYEELKIMAYYRTYADCLKFIKNMVLDYVNNNNKFEGFEIDVYDTCKRKQVLELFFTTRDLGGKSWDNIILGSDKFDYLLNYTEKQKLLLYKN